MKHCMLTSVLALVLATSCSKPEKVGDAAQSDTRPIAESRSDDLHPDSRVVVRISSSEYEENLTIPSDWDGSKYCCYTFNCPSSSIGRLLKFLHWSFELSSPEVVGAEYLPKGLYCVSFGEKKWDRKEDVVRDVMQAVEVAFQLDISLQESPRRLVIRKKTPNSEQRSAAR